jgi:hypothetical protein
LDCGSDDLLLLLRGRNCGNSVIRLETVVSILAVVAPFDDKFFGLIGDGIIERLLLRSTGIS